MNIYCDQKSKNTAQRFTSQELRSVYALLLRLVKLSFSCAAIAAVVSNVGSVSRAAHSHTLYSWRFYRAVNKTTSALNADASLCYSAQVNERFTCGTD